MCFEFSLISGLEDSGRLDGGAFPVVPWDIGSFVAAGDSSGSVGQPRGSCRLEAWHCCWAACRVVGLEEPGRGCPQEIRLSCQRQRHWHRHLKVQARSGRPARC